VSKKRTKSVFIKIVRHRHHDEITDQQTEQIRVIYSKIGNAYSGETFEQFERDFLFDSDIDMEIRWWKAIAKVFQRCLNLFPEIDQTVAAKSTVLISIELGIQEDDLPHLASSFLRRNVPSRSSFLYSPA